MPGDGSARLAAVELDAASAGGRVVGGGTPHAGWHRLSIAARAAWRVIHLRQERIRLVEIFLANFDICQSVGVNSTPAAYRCTLRLKCGDSTFNG